MCTQPANGRTLGTHIAPSAQPPLLRESSTIQGSQTAEAGERACHSATLPLDGPPDDTTIASWAEIVRRSSDPAREIRTTRSSAKLSSEGPEEKITIEIRTESGDDDAGAAWIKYENELVTLAGEGPDEATALQWMKRLSARFLQPDDDEKEQKAGELQG